MKTINGRSLVIGGAGFIGSNVAARLLELGKKVRVLDNLSRPGVEANLRWLCSEYGDRLEFVKGDVRDRHILREALGDVQQVYHYAAQVAVTTSLLDPFDDFERNALGTLNVLEEMRRLPNPPSLVFTSTNKVYGSLDDVSLRQRDTRYEPEDPIVRMGGIGEDRPLDFHSPYGCSKGAADQYVLDYARTFGLKTVVFRMSCIYGPHQMGVEDQGWVAHFLIQAMRGNPITLYGDGRQVRDILYIEDLVDAFLLAQKNIGRLSGNAFNMGGGLRNTISLLELLDLIEELEGERPKVLFDDWRPGDQRYYVSDFSKFRIATGWSPKVSARRGIEALHAWLADASGNVAEECLQAKAVAR